MSRTIIINLVGDQTLPNVLFIKAIPDATDYWFIETERTQKDQRVLSIRRTCQIADHRVKVILVQAEALNFTPRADWHLHESDTVHLNLTGGTKAMMIAAMRHYEPIPQTRMAYIPIGGKQAISLTKWPPIDLPEVNLSDYFLAHGYVVTCALPDTTKKHEIIQIYNQVVKSGDAGKVPTLLDVAQQYLAEEDKAFYSGGWWELFFYYKLKKELALPDDQIALNIKASSIVSKLVNQPDMEIDIGFMWRGRLYIVECKVFTGRARKGPDIFQYIHKISTLNRTLGLHAVGILALLGHLTQDTQSSRRIQFLQQLSGIQTILTLAHFQKESSLRKHLKLN